MRAKNFVRLIVLFFCVSFSMTGIDSAEDISLPAQKLEGPVSLEEAINGRRSLRSFSERALSLEQVSRILWAGQGITGDRAFKRAAPSAGGLCPLELFLAVRADRVDGLSAGVYHYIARGHRLELVKTGEHNTAVAQAALGQMWLAGAPALVIVTADYSRTTVKYGQRGIRYVHIDTGLASENMLLQAVALGLSTCPVGAFRDKELAKALGLEDSLDPLLIIAVGYK